MFLQREAQRRYECVFSYTANANHVFRGEILPWLRDLIGILNNLPEWAQIERVFKVFAAFCE